LILTTIVLFVILGVSARENSKLNWFGNLFNSAISPVQKAFSVSAQKVGSTLSFFQDSKAIKEENKKLKARVQELEKENENLKGLKDKNEELKKLVNMKDQFSDFEFLGSNIISMDAGNWFNTFGIDRGSTDGIETDNAVIAGEGLVGRITTVGPISSKVMSILDVDSTISARLTKSSKYVLVKGDINLKDKGFCRMDNIPADADVAVGDSVETSGIGGIYPKGITIGKVVEVRQVNNEMNRYAIVKPVVDFDKLETVSVLKNKVNTKDR
jgi:rod shape-determining protein MreC